MFVSIVSKAKTGAFLGVGSTSVKIVKAILIIIEIGSIVALTLSLHGSHILHQKYWSYSLMGVGLSEFFSCFTLKKSKKTASLPLRQEIIPKDKQELFVERPLNERHSTRGYISEKIKGELGEDVSRILRLGYDKRNYTIETRFTGMTYQPTNEGMKFIANHYKSKYNIDILVIDKSELSNQMESLSKLHNDRLIGIIVTDGAGGHVIPLLYDLKDQSYLILDSLGWVDREIIGILGDKYFNGNTPRQADHYSCRVDALVLLRNILLNLKGEENHLKDVLVKKDCVINGSLVDSLPSEWIYTSQIFGSNNNPHIDRDRYSANPSKSKNPKKVMDFRKKHSEEAVQSFSIQIDENEWGQLKQLNLKKNLTLVISSNGVRYLVLERRKMFCTYLVEKGRKFRELYLRSVKNLKEAPSKSVESHGHP